MSAALVWFRRDLRDFDHAALYAALVAHDAVHCAFVFDADILDLLPRRDRRVRFIHESVRELKAALEARGGGLQVLRGGAREEVPRLAPASGAMPSLEDLGFEATDLAVKAGMAGGRELLADFKRRISGYGERRDFPALKGPSYLSVHLRFGTVSIRELAGYAWQQGSDGAAVWLSELAWRDFYFMVLAVRPDVVQGAFKREFNDLRFDDHESHWLAWCGGATGYPLVDAAMRQLNTTGYMHNRLRMVTASFLVKDLGIDWRRGERYFAEHLNDYDLAANNGGWQWAASTGCDAQPYFRIFNPVTQSERFDAEGRFIRKYVPELARVAAKFVHAPWRMDAQEQARSACVIGRDYPAPVVDHAAARIRTLERYAAARTR